MTSASLARRVRPGGVAAAIAVGVLLTGSIAIDPLLPLGIVGGAGFLAAAAFRPKAFAAVGTVLIALSVPIQNVVGAAGGYVDEAVVAVAAVAFGARRLATEGRLRMLPGGAWFLAFVLLGVASSVAREVGAATWLPAGYLAIKGVLFAWALAQLRWSETDIHRLARWGAIATIVVTVMGVLNLAAPGAWAQLTTGAAPIRGLGGLPELNGPFQHPAAFSRFCSVLAIGALAYAFVMPAPRTRPLLLAAAASSLMFLTFETKSLVGGLIVLGLLCVRFANVRGIVAALCLLPLILGASAPAVASLVGADVQSYVQEDSARGRLTLGGAVIATEYFPLGAGFGRWGSSTAATDYSPEYVVMGFSDVFGLGPADKGQFLNDTQWPAIYGEGGVFGGVAFAIGLGCMLVSMLRRTGPAEPKIVLWLRTAGAGWLIALTVESIVGPVFVSTPSFPFVFAAAGIVAAIRKDGITPTAQPTSASRQAASING